MKEELKSWQQRLLLAVGQGIERYGFDERRMRQQYVKKRHFGSTIFHLAFIKHQDDFDVTADVGIRFDQVEELANSFREDLKKQEKARTCTVGVELGNLSEGRQKRWTVASADDIQGVASSILDTFATVALPYFEKYSDPQRVLEIVSGDGPDSWLHSPIHGKRAERAVSMALQMNGNEAARQLAKLKLAFLEERKDFGLPSFHAFLNKLGLQVNELI